MIPNIHPVLFSRTWRLKLRSVWAAGCRQASFCRMGALGFWYLRSAMFKILGESCGNNLLSCFWFVANGGAMILNVAKLEGSNAATPQPTQCLSEFPCGFWGSHCCMPLVHLFSRETTWIQHMMQSSRLFRHSMTPTRAVMAGKSASFKLIEAASTVAHRKLVRSWRPCRSRLPIPKRRYSCYVTFEIWRYGKTPWGFLWGFLWECRFCLWKCARFYFEEKQLKLHNKKQCVLFSLKP